MQPPRRRGTSDSYDEDMQPEGGKTLSVWAGTADVPGRPSLASDLTTDVCIVGAGIAGLTTAYLLAREGRAVVVLDDGPIGGGETGRTTAHLASALDDRFYQLEQLHGETGARLAAQSHAAAIDRIEAIVAESGIDCDFGALDGYLFVAGGEPADELDRELDAARAGRPRGREGRARSARLLRHRARAALRPPGPVPSAALPRRPGQGHPGRGRADLLRRARRADRGRRQRAREDGDGTHGRRRRRSWWPPTRPSTIASRSTPSRRPTAPTRSASRSRRAAFRKALFWDTADPYHYVRLQGQEGGRPDLLIVGGEDHRTGQADDTEERWTRLERWTRERLPMAQAATYKWSGQVMEPVDGLAFIGRNPLDKDNVFIATGDSGQGMTHGTIAGMLITDLIQGRTNPWAASLRSRPAQHPRHEGFRHRAGQLPEGLRALGDARGGRVAGRDPAGRGPDPAGGPPQDRGLSRPRASSSSSPRSARTSAASCSGTPARRRGTARATARVSHRTGTS